MYRMSRYEFMQFEIAEKRLKELKIQHAAELQCAYDDINPTMTNVDYDLGTLHSASVDPANYAIYLVEMQEEHKRSEEYWDLRAKAYKQALRVCEQDKNKLHAALSEIVKETPELQRVRTTALGELDVEEYDEQVERMSDAELFEDYWSLDDHLELNEKIQDKCYWLRDVKEMTFNEIGKAIGITSSRAKEIIEQANPIP